MKGWILDCYPDQQRDCMVIWLKTEHGIERLVDRHFMPSFYARSTSEESLRKIAADLRMIDVPDTCIEMHSTLMHPEPMPFLRVTPGDYASLGQTARLVYAWGRYREHELYNVDLRLDQRCFLKHDIFPMGLLDVGTTYRMLDSQDRIIYPVPDLTTAELKVNVRASRGIPVADDVIESVSFDDVLLDGTEEGILEEL